ncbi:MAG: hypothetical protein UT43_C0044G0005 [Parcubacteria group bacterium GW2011_GWC1_39_29]|nr:MAG: hypothetical protein UT43_C0044G0005 [Parcubacteria group bacterium GW2011_GWC1_39_29]
MDILQKLTQGLLQGENLVLVGISDSGKTRFVKEELIPELEKNEKKVVYFKDGPSITNQEADIYIFDETESFCDREYLEEKYSEEKPYYTDEYERKVKDWFWSYKKHDKSCLYIITRKNEDDIEYLRGHLRWADWDDRKLETFAFE